MELPTTDDIAYSIDSFKDFVTVTNEILYHRKMLAYIHPISNNKAIVFTPEFKEKYDISEDNPMVFDEGFFDYG
ncbi:hypothetical protein PQ459_14010 [Chryseobacterium sp. KACC 21268]|nr:hypothetical protein PQ459_14010 [Chryseobacterium sp. KACC 21268]